MSDKSNEYDNLRSILRTISMYENEDPNKVLGRIVCKIEHMLP